MAAKKNILLVSYYFPPLGMAGVGRPCSLYKYLPKFGYKVYVLTVKKVVYPHYDFSLLRSPDEERIVRTGSLDPARILYKMGLRRFEGGYGKTAGAALLNFPDSKRGWNVFALPKARRLLVKHQIKAVITTSPPPSIHIIGMRIKSQYDIKWIADFRDYWFSRPIEEMSAYGLQRSYALRLKRRIVAAADEVVGVNSAIKAYLGRGRVIMNGADQEYEEEWQSAKAAREELVIGVLGSIHDICPIEPLFRIYSEAVRRHPAMKKSIRIMHAGHYDEREMKVLRNKYGLGDRISWLGYLPKAKAFRALAGADILYFGLRKVHEYNILPGRIFDYFLSGKPILAVAPPDSEAFALLGEYDLGKLITEDSLDEGGRYLHEIYLRKNEGRGVTVSEDRDRSKYTSMRLAEEYARLLDGLL